jgi:hypothetical protein
MTALPAFEISDDLAAIKAGEQEGLRGTAYVDGLAGCLDKYGNYLYGS